MGLFRTSDSGTPAQVQAVMSESQQNSAAVLQVLQALGKAKTAIEATRIALDTVRRAFGWTYGPTGRSILARVNCASWPSPAMPVLSSAGSP